MFDARTNLARDAEAEVRAHFPNTFKSVIPRSVRLAEAPSHGEPITVFDPTSSGARAYIDLADELIEALRARDLLPAPAPVPAVIATTPTAVAAIPQTSHDVATIPDTSRDVTTIPNTPRDLAPADLLPRDAGAFNGQHHTEQPHGA